MWLHLPSTCCPSVPVSECSTLPSELPYVLERFATLSGKHSPPRSWRHAWQRKRWMKRLSGLTLPHSTVEAGAGSWIASLRASRASPTASPESEKATPTEGASAKATVRSCTSCGSSRKSCLPWCSSKTSQPGLPLEISGSDQSASDFQRWVTESKNRSSSLRTMLARTTSASGSSSWPTARAEDSESCGTHPGSKGGDSLTGVLKTWPTPNAADSKTSEDYPHKRGNPTLVMASSQWPTPDAHANERVNRSPSDGAAERPTIALAAKNWKTPHGMAGVDHTGKAGAGGEFAKQVEAWQTPAAENFRSRGGDRKDEPGLDRQAKLWRTPDAPSSGGVRTHTTSAGKGHQTTIAEQAEIWQTPKALSGGPNSRSEEREGNWTPDLQEQARGWPTPAARDAKGENSLQHMRRTDGRTEQESCRPTAELRDDELFAPGPADERWGRIVAERPYLAPAILAGSVRVWWDDATGFVVEAAPESGLHRVVDGLAVVVDESRRDQLRATGNGVVPLQAALAFAVLAREAGLMARAQFEDQVIEVAA